MSNDFELGLFGSMAGAQLGAKIEPSAEFSDLYRQALNDQIKFVSAMSESRRKLDE